MLRVAAQSYMPYSAIKGSSRSSASTARSCTHVADRLGLEDRAELTDFDGMLGGVQSRRVDITVGGVAWTEGARRSRGCSPTRRTTRRRRWACASGKHYETVEDLQGQRLGTVTGYVWVKSIQAVPGAKLGAYPSALGVFDDLARAGSTSASSTRC